MRGRTTIYILAAATCGVAAVSCSFDWDAFDPRVNDNGTGTSAAGVGGAASSTGAAPGGSAAGGGTASGGNQAGGGGAGGVPNDWIDPAFTRRRTIDFGNPAGEAMTDVPVLVRLDDSRIDYMSMQPDGADLRFYDATNQALSHEVETWRTSSDSYVWVRLPELPANGTSIRMYYASNDGSTPSDPAAVWSNGYLAVWHMTAGVADSLGGYPGAPLGVTTAGGIAGDAQVFGDGDAVGIGGDDNFDGLFTFGATVSAWVRAGGWGGAGFGRIVDKSIEDNASGGWALFLSSVDETFGFRRAHATTDGHWEGPANSIDFGTWHYLAVTYSELAMVAPLFFLDGVAVATQTSAAPIGAPQSDAGSPIRIGNAGTLDSQVFNGRIDEVRVSNAPRSIGWMALQDASMRDTIASFGVEEQR